MGDMMFGFSWMEMLVLLGTVGIGAIVITYLTLRLFVWGKAESKSLEYIRRHALWTGVIAWAVSNLTGANRAGIYDPNRFYTNDWQSIPWPAIIAPAIAVVTVHAIGQSTWPVPKSPKRVAVLEFRRARDYVEPVLGWTVAGIFTLTAAVLGFLFFAPGFVSANSVILGDSGESIQTHFGRAPGCVPATALTVAFAILAVGTLLVMRLIASRRSLEALSPEQNKTLRTIGMNRLLRVSATVASGLAAVAGNYLSQPAPDSNATSWINWLAIVNMVVLIAMLFWKPPALVANENDAGLAANAFPASSAPPTSSDDAAAVRFTGWIPLVAAGAAALGFPVGVIVLPWFGWLGPLTTMVVFALLAFVVMETLLRRNFATPGNPKKRLKAAVPRPLLWAVAVAIAALIPALIASNSINRGGFYDWHGFGDSTPHALAPLLCGVAIAGVGSAAACLVWFRPSLTSGSELLDRTLRRRALFRITRTTAGGLTAVLAGLLFNIGSSPATAESSPDTSLGMVGAVCAISALTLCFFPVKGYTPKNALPQTQRTSAGR